jgi:hypothetical protein
VSARETTGESEPLIPYTSLVLQVYVVGFILMVLFNARCYPGTFVGVFGWAAIWPFYVPANLARILLSLQSGDGATAAMFWGEVCQTAVMGLRAG